MEFSKTCNLARFGAKICWTGLTKSMKLVKIVLTNNKNWFTKLLVILQSFWEKSFPKSQSEGNFIVLKITILIKSFDLNQNINQRKPKWWLIYVITWVNRSNSMEGYKLQQSWKTNCKLLHFKWTEFGWSPNPWDFWNFLNTYINSRIWF